MIKPKKPYPDFPLYPHASGHWAKKIRGKTHYFGRWDDWEAALDRFNNEKEALYAGHDPKKYYNSGLTVGLALDLFLSAKQQLVDTRDLKQRTYDDYHNVCTAIAKRFGKGRSVQSLLPADFELLRASLRKRLGPTRLSRDVVYVRMVFNYCYEANHLEAPVRFGPEFKPAPKREQRLQRHRVAGSKLFAPEELRAIVSKCGMPLRAMALLGINCGFGNHDCGLLRFVDIDLASGWHSMARTKTGIPRRAKLWPETVTAIQEAIARRPKSDDPLLEDLVFVTKRRRCFYKDAADSPITKAFRKVLGSTGTHRQYRGFYALRHTFRTIAGRTRDKDCVDFIMGHADETMSARYLQGLEDDRIEQVTDFVRAWYLGKGVKEGVPNH